MKSKIPTDSYTKILLWLDKALSASYEVTSVVSYLRFVPLQLQISVSP
jgi:hypothetical protein